MAAAAVAAAVAMVVAAVAVVLPLMIMSSVSSNTSGCRGCDMQMIRKKTKVRGHCGSDFSYTCFCCCFALAQEARHLDAKPYKGGEIIPLPRWRKCLLPCFPVRKRDDRLLKSAREVCMSKKHFPTSALD